MQSVLLLKKLYIFLHELDRQVWASLLQKRSSSDARFPAIMSEATTIQASPTTTLLAAAAAAAAAAPAAAAEQLPSSSSR